MHRLPALWVQLARIAGLLCSFVLAAAAAMAPMLNSIYYESFNPARLAVVLASLLTLHVLRCQRLLFSHEFAWYSGLLGYMFLSLLWAPDALLGMNTLLPALNFFLILLLFGSLAMFHDLKAVLPGMLCGFLVGTGFYTATEGFPFVYPQGFSYNAMAGMYLFGLFIVLVWGWHTRRRLLCLSLAMIVLIHIAATTSIKTNLGILLGTAAAAVVYFRKFLRVWRNNAFALVIVSAAIAYAIASNDALLERVQIGVDRVAIGVEILRAREDTSHGTSFGEREDWKDVGLAGWADNPIFGHGVEAFRSDQGITSHSTPIDLLYNFGLIGLALFYGMFGALAWRLFGVRQAPSGELRVLVFGGLICYVFMSLSGTMHYNSYVAIFISVSVALLRRQSLHGQRAT